MRRAPLRARRRRPHRAGVTRRQREVLAGGGEELGSPALSHDNRTLYFTHVASEGDVWLATLR